MPHHKSAKKRMRRAETRTAVNRARKGRIHTFIRKVEEAIAASDPDVARAALKAAQPEIMRGAGHGVLRANTASRRVSRLSARIKAMAG